MKQSATKLSIWEKCGYSAGDAAASFVFLTMILFQANFYTDVVGLTATTAATILLAARLWDAVADPIVGVLADRTRTRWGKFRPWILWTTIPWCLSMVFAYSAPSGWSTSAVIIYATVTNMLLMSIYSMNNVPYSALGAVLTADVDERAKLNTFRFIAVNLSQFVAGGLTLPLVAKLSAQHDRQYGWRMTMTIWAAICLVLFLITFFTTRERVPSQRLSGSVRQDFRALLRSSPWTVMFLVTLVHFCILSFRGGALYNYYHHYADKQAMFDWTGRLGLTAADGPAGESSIWRVLETLGYVVHVRNGDFLHSNVADVFNSIINVTNTIVTIIVLLLAPAICRRFGKRTVLLTGFSLAALGTLAFGTLQPRDADGMFWWTVLIAACYAPTIPALWAMYADVADYAEWFTGRCCTGMTFATLGFALKIGLALGSSGFLWIMAGLFQYSTAAPDAPLAMEGFRWCSSLGVGSLFVFCTLLLFKCKLNKRLTLHIARELDQRRTLPAGA